MSRAAERSFPTEAQIKRMIRAAQAAGLHVLGIRRRGDAFEVVTGDKPAQDAAVTDLERWKAQRDARRDARG
jgi:hypothetical protein